jgi:hypothetical protein
MNETKTETRCCDFKTDCNKFNELKRTIKNHKKRKIEKNMVSAGSL